MGRSAVLVASRDLRTWIIDIDATIRDEGLLEMGRG
jgi:hypothetical protein